MPETPPRPDPVAAATAEARALARQLLQTGHAALAWTDPETGTPGISRIAFADDPQAGPLTLISGLAPHFAALRANPDCALMVGEVGGKGDPMTHPRLMIRAGRPLWRPRTPTAPPCATAGWPATPRRRSTSTCGFRLRPPGAAIRAAERRLRPRLPPVARRPAALTGAPGRRDTASRTRKSRPEAGTALRLPQTPTGGPEGPPVADPRERIRPAHPSGSPPSPCRARPRPSADAPASRPRPAPPARSGRHSAWRWRHW